MDQIRGPVPEAPHQQRVFMRCDVNFDMTVYGRNLNSFIGRAAHIEFLESDIFARFIMWSFQDLFRWILYQVEEILGFTGRYKLLYISYIDRQIVLSTIALERKIDSWPTSNVRSRRKMFFCSLFLFSFVSRNINFVLDFDLNSIVFEFGIHTSLPKRPNP